ncbi:hypothetical protein ACOJR9_13565 [Alteromonas sp. A081]|uniref:hypothetical protein n=1 Tax=Alteromonas sp. A081 TaxID=3410269 RepID=UPI003B985331
MTKRRTLLWLLASLLTLLSFQSVAVKWDAEWIWNQQKIGNPNTWIALRKEVDINDFDNIANDQTITAYISADTKYCLWINGEMVVFEGSYTGGPSPVKPSPRVDSFPIASNKYYDQVDIKKYLKESIIRINSIAELCNRCIFS